MHQILLLLNRVSFFSYSGRNRSLGNASSEGTAEPSFQSQCHSRLWFLAEGGSVLKT